MQNYGDIVLVEILSLFAATPPSPSRQGTYKVKHLSVLGLFEVLYI